MLTDPLLQGGGGGGLGGPRLALLQRTALVVHAATLELAQQVKEALLVRGRSPRDALGVAVSQRWPEAALLWASTPHRSLNRTGGWLCQGPRSGPSSATCWPPCPEPTPRPAPAPPPSPQPSSLPDRTLPFPWVTHTLPLQPQLHSLKCPC